MAHYFASDVHLREDHPERDRRFRSWLAGLSSDDALYINGDLCDFWMAAREAPRRLAEYPSIRALADFRERGGALAIMAGNHDRWLCSFYREALGAVILEEPADLVVHGLRVRMVHGHRLGSRQFWKAGMESQAFFRAFGHIPERIAWPLDHILASRNERTLFTDEERHLAVFRPYVASCRSMADLVVIGHVHSPIDERFDGIRMIVPGGWQLRSSYLVIDEFGAHLRVVPDDRSPHPPPNGLGAEIAPAANSPPAEAE